MLESKISFCEVYRFIHDMEWKCYSSLKMIMMLILQPVEWIKHNFLRILETETKPKGSDHLLLRLSHLENSIEYSK